MKILFLVFIVFSTLSLSSAKSSSSVLDINRNFLRYGTGYYILPVIRGRGGGIALTPTSINQKCPLNVVQESVDDRNGLPLSFIPANTTKDAIIRESSDLNIVFQSVTICGQPPVWRLEVVNGQGTVSSRGTIGSPGRDTLGNWFKIEKYGGNGYKLVYCPAVCNTCKPVCGDIGVAKSGRRSLILSKEPLIVMFKKA
ncbi:putative proteinase inhibitor I3, Kunitz legume, kunitz inhibitor STI-like superfamily [Helianthus annuus]|uniref:Kunitz family trypsin and protease inhibitor protein n=1 Tax=Helianthus annuus TaxID=4232 RepID=A0A251SIJ2_HELAN|nr:miraculin [Helianthus annuus]KAF5769317.1 putative proteinase inhibitor I3, Kunitz legume, kunitz inhibitor STI-like superfamily [Helianthus annuus]KAJ0464378.1 putative proteinase inhibitor I3, Kunitz legume, kunitz inhibitor STI-like superfamily [Helianthus annuus]KAJ0468869.1 putative proteinase inhibitor I3, Kunitz legume, kunitz inhibitor STI-like superfamily [Helianthus annuus]KAJ0485946.1 putative proteinase inhibitor I3, Kunitz legume, kunitz inhibitor STI-like superfamily [Helianthu